MPKLCVRNFSISLDGYAAAPNQSLEHPFGEPDPPLHEWMLATRFGRQIMGEDGGTEGLDNVIAERLFANIGASIMGRNMFGPIRGAWENDDWTGWWGPNPPYHHQVFVLTHHPRASITMERAGTTFHFVRRRAIEAARATRARSTRCRRQGRAEVPDERRSSTIRAVRSRARPASDEARRARGQVARSSSAVVDSRARSTTGRASSPGSRPRRWATSTWQSSSARRPHVIVTKTVSIHSGGGARFWNGGAPDTVGRRRHAPDADARLLADVTSVVATSSVVAAGREEHLVRVRHVHRVAGDVELDERGRSHGRRYRSPGPRQGKSSLRHGKSRRRPVFLSGSRTDVSAPRGPGERGPSAHAVY